MDVCVPAVTKPGMYHVAATATSHPFSMGLAPASRPVLAVTAAKYECIRAPLTISLAHVCNNGRTIDNEESSASVIIL